MHFELRTLVSKYETDLSKQLFAQGLYLCNPTIISFIFFSLGNITDVKKAGGFSAFLRDNHKKYGPIFSFYWQKELCVSLASPELWKDVVALFDRPGK